MEFPSLLPVRGIVPVKGTVTMPPWAKFPVTPLAMRGPIPNDPVVMVAVPREAWGCIRDAAITGITTDG